MIFKVEITDIAKKALKTIDPRYIKKIRERIDLLEIDPRHHGSIKMSGYEDTYRTRVGKYRIIYKIHDKKVIVMILNIDHRKDVYR